MAAWHQMLMFLRRHETHTGDKRQDVLPNLPGIQFVFCLPFRRPCGWSSACPQRSWAPRVLHRPSRRGLGPPPVRPSFPEMNGRCGGVRSSASRWLDSLEGPSPLEYLVRVHPVCPGQQRYARAWLRRGVLDHRVSERNLPLCHYLPVKWRLWDLYKAVSHHTRPTSRLQTA
jgi:hypothetical protein